MVYDQPAKLNAFLPPFWDWAQLQRNLLIVLRPKDKCTRAREKRTFYFPSTRKWHFEYLIVPVLYFKLVNTLVI